MCVCVCVYQHADKILQMATFDSHRHNSKPWQTSVHKTSAIPCSVLKPCTKPSTCHTYRPNKEAPRKRKPAESRRQIKKRARLAMAMFQTAPASEAAKPSAPAQPLGEVFEQTGDGSGQRRIQLRLPGAVTDAPASSSRPEGVAAPPPGMYRKVANVLKFLWRYS